MIRSLEDMFLDLPARAQEALVEKAETLLKEFSDHEPEDGALCDITEAIALDDFARRLLALKASKQ